VATTSTKVEGDADKTAEGGEGKFDLAEEQMKALTIVRHHLGLAQMEISEMMKGMDMTKKEHGCMEVQIVEDDHRDHDAIVDDDDGNDLIPPGDKAVLVGMKEEMVRLASTTLREGAQRLRDKALREQALLNTVMKTRGAWKIWAPLHSKTAQTPLSLDEPLAVDCSFVSAGSTYVPAASTLGEISDAELIRLTKLVPRQNNNADDADDGSHGCITTGQVRVGVPSQHHQLTIQTSIVSAEGRQVAQHTMALRNFAAPIFGSSQAKSSTDDVVMGTTANAEAATTGSTSSPEPTAAAVEMENNTRLRWVQHSLFCKETFKHIMAEAKHTTSPANPQAQPASPSSPWITHMDENEIHVSLYQGYRLCYKLVSVEPETSKLPTFPQTDKSVAAAAAGAGGGAAIDTAMEVEDDDDADAGATATTPNSGSGTFWTRLCETASILAQIKTRDTHAAYSPNRPAHQRGQRVPPSKLPPARRRLTSNVTGNVPAAAPSSSANASDPAWKDKLLRAKHDKIVLELDERSTTGVGLRGSTSLQVAQDMLEPQTHILAHVTTRLKGIVQRRQLENVLHRMAVKLDDKVPCFASFFPSFRPFFLLHHLLFTSFPPSAHPP
jgi:hypothetical protein